MQQLQQLPKVETTRHRLCCGWRRRRDGGEACLDGGSAVETDFSLDIVLGGDAVCSQVFGVGTEAYQKVSVSATSNLMLTQQQQPDAGIGAAQEAAREQKVPSHPS